MCVTGRHQGGHQPGAGRPLAPRPTKRVRAPAPTLKNERAFLLAQDKPSNRITVIAAVAKVATQVDGGIRVTLDMPEQAIAQAAWLMVAKREGIAIKVAMEHAE